jgi:hypothetical protein
MRGDSLRDLYAKLLALAGLGVLAGTGALVDYWPTGNGMPAVRAGLDASALVEASRESALAIPSSEDPQPERAVATRRMSLRRFTAPPPALAVASSFDADAIAVREVDLVAPATRYLPAVTLQAYAGQEMTLSDPALLVAHRRASLGDEETLADDDGSALTGVVRKTGKSIVRTSKRTGASIVDAVRMIGTAVRRVLPDL